MLVRRPYTIESMLGQCLEPWRVGRCVPFCWVESDYPHIWKVASVRNDFNTFLLIDHPLRVARSTF